MVPSLSLPKKASMTFDANNNTYFGGKTCLENSLHARQTQPALAPCFREPGLENVSLFSALFHNPHNACTTADAPARFFPNSPFLRYRFQFGVCGSFGRSAGGRRSGRGGGGARVQETMGRSVLCRRLRPRSKATLHAPLPTETPGDARVSAGGIKWSGGAGIPQSL